LISDSRLWDVAAGWLLVTAAGGVMTMLDGTDIFPLDVSRYAGQPVPSLASATAALHKDLLPQ
jgi:fructose-1,6-bisphosphatase/inositol monophosphatase family enzyme